MILSSMVPVAAIKRTCLTVVLYFCIYFCMATIHGPSSWLIGVFMGLVAAMIADFIVIGHNARKARFEVAQHFLRENWSRTCLLVMQFAVIIFLCGDRQAPSEPFVLQLVSLLASVGLVSIMLAIIIPSLFKAYFSFDLSAINWFGGLFNQLIRGLTIYAVTLWAIGEWGDLTYRWVMTNQSEAVVIATSLPFILIMVYFVGESRDYWGANLTSNPVSAVRPDQTAVSSKPTSRDVRHIAAHEAGHALIYAALGQLPADVRLVVNEYQDTDRTLGFITGVNSEHLLTEKSFAEWHMLMLLAGQIGESIRLGEPTMGSCTDHRRWINEARLYLANQNKGIYYVEPQNKFEQEQNEVKLEALQTAQRELLHQFFDMNAEVYQQLADNLLDVRVMGHDDLMPYLSRVKLPEGFPVCGGLHE